MEISEFSIRIILLFLPGIIAKLIIESLTVYKEKRLFYFTIYSLVLGFFSYFCYIYFLKSINLLPFISIQTDVQFLKALLDTKNTIDIIEVLNVSIFSIFIGLFFSFAINRKYFHRIAQSLKITRKFAEMDVWQYLFNSTNSTEWITVRDIKNNLMYEGWVQAFSDTVTENELFLRDVMVFNNTTGDKLYEVPGLYISRNKDEITIEFTALEFTDSIKRSKNITKNGDTKNEH